MVEVNTHHEKLHTSYKTGKAQRFPQDMVVPGPRGWRMELQLMPADYVGQAVRPWTTTVTYYNTKGKAVTWTQYLGQYSSRATNQSLWSNLYYGKQVKADLIDRLKATVQSEANRAVAL